MKQTVQVKAPIIGISANLLTIDSGSFIGCERVAVNQTYIQAVQLAGGVPLVLPIIQKQEGIQQQVELVDGLLLSGGYDVSPLLYEEEPKKGLENVCPERDAYEIQLIQMCQRLHKPIFGICRGLQLLNVALGGTLYQDIGLAVPTALQHQQKAKPSDATHSVTLVNKTKLQHIMGENILVTNSFHHQAIQNLAPDLVVNAQTKDGIIEGIEGTGDLFILGVQWHPEHMVVKHPKMLKLFQAFVEAARKRRAI